MDSFIRDHNPKITLTTAAYRVALEKLSGLLFQNRGRLIADWYNFTAQQFTDTTTLTPVIEEAHLPKAMEDLLLRDYADRLIGHGEIVDLGQEHKLLKTELAGATTTVSTIPLSGVKSTKAKTLDALLHEFYPEWSRMNKVKQRMTLDVLYGINPALRNSDIKRTADRTLPIEPMILPEAKALFY
jgi:hypothetical protein